MKLSKIALFFVFFLFVWPVSLNAFQNHIFYYSIKLISECSAIGTGLFQAKYENPTFKNKDLVIGDARFQKKAFSLLKKSVLDASIKRNTAISIQFNYQTLSSLLSILEHLEKEGVRRVVLEFNTAIWTDFTSPNTTKQKFLEEDPETSLTPLNYFMNAGIVLKRTLKLFSGSECEYKKFLNPNRIFSASFLDIEDNNYYENDLQKLEQAANNMDLIWLADINYFEKKLQVEEDTRQDILTFLRSGRSNFGTIVVH